MLPGKIIDKVRTLCEEPEPHKLIDFSKGICFATIEKNTAKFNGFFTLNSLFWLG
jgi:hypothetical protein